LAQEASQPNSNLISLNYVVISDDGCFRRATADH